MYRAQRLREAPPGHRAWALELAAIMEEQGLGQVDIAGRCDVSQQLVSHWLDGRPPKLDKVRKIERRLEVEPGRLTRLLGYVPIEEE